MRPSPYPLRCRALVPRRHTARLPVHKSGAGLVRTVAELCALLSASQSSGSFMGSDGFFAMRISFPWTADVYALNATLSRLRRSLTGTSGATLAGMLATLTHDLRDAARNLRRNRGFAAS